MGTSGSLCANGRGQHAADPKKTDSSARARHPTVRSLRAKVIQITGGTVVEKEQRLLIDDLVPLLERHYRISGLRSWRKAACHLSRLTAQIGALDVATMAPSDIESYKDVRLAAGVSRGTVNQELGLLRSAINLARKQRVIAEAPEVTLFPPAPPRRGFLHAHEAARLLFSIESQDSDVADAVRLLWGLGWRSSEVIGLTWDEADAKGGSITLSPERSKTKDPRTVKLHGELRDLLIKRWNMRAGPWVFHRKGKPIKDFRGVWLRACKVCSKSGLLVHDLRRSFARHALRAGVPQPIIMQIAGWKTESVFRRYAIVDEGVVEDALRKISAYREG